MRRSNAPLFWVPFGAGGMLAALTGPALVFITGIAVPLGWLLHPDTLGYARVLALAQHWWGKSLLFLVIALYAWHAVHRIYHSLHDLGIPAGAPGKLLCYGTALAITLAVAVSLLLIGW